MSSARCVFLPSALLALASLCSAQLTITGFNGLTASVSSTGAYSVSLPVAAWQLKGSTNVPVHSARIASGANNLGNYQELAFDYSAGVSNRSATIRAYSDRPLVLFAITWNNDSPNAAPFPDFTSYPTALFSLSFSGMFGWPTFTSLAADSPWVLFDASANTLIVSPASDYMVAATTNGPNGNEIRSGIESHITTLPAGMTHQTAVVYGQGINSTISSWGRALTDLSGKIRPASDADILLKSVSYWTDNGATYYYNPGGSSYSATLQAVKAEFVAKGISLGSLQLDSWWYPKGPDNAWSSHGGIWTYQATPGLLQPDLAGFQASLGIPLALHARWIDAASPYRSKYQMSGNVAIDPQYWEDVGTYLSSSGAAVYEQDWLGQQAQTDLNLTDPYAFLGNMSASLANRGITMMYCMPDTRHFLQGTTYSNLTTIRSSQDGFGPARWTEFLYASQLAAATGAWPFTDVFKSTEYSSLLLATLSAGPVGIGDALGNISKANLLKAVRPDGVIVKPDVPAMPLDTVYVADAASNDVPMVAATYSDFGGLRASYIFAYPRAANTQFSIRPTAYGIPGTAYLYDYFGKSGQVINPGDSVTLNIAGSAAYYILVAAGKTGIAFLGDNGHFVTLGKKRITTLSDNGQVDATVSFAPGEKVRTLFGYSPNPITAVALSGSVGRPAWDSSTQLFTIAVRPTKQGVAHIHLNQIAGPATVGNAAVQ